jgi:hypothetical protein
VSLEKAYLREKKALLDKMANGAMLDERKP